MFTSVGLIIQSSPLPESDNQEGLRLTVPTPPAIAEFGTLSEGLHAAMDAPQKHTFPEYWW